MNKSAIRDTDRRMFLDVLKSEKGISLVETLAAIGLFSIFVLSFVNYAGSHGVELSSLQHNTEINNTVTKIMTAFGDSEDQCARILGGRAFDPSIAAGIPVNSIDYYNVTSAAVENVITAGQPIGIGGVINSQNSLKPVITINAQNVYAQLEVNFRMVRNSAGASDLVRKIPIYLTLAGGNISTCSTVYIPHLTLKNRLCEIQNGGYSHYDPTLRVCVDDSIVTWFNSPNPSIATCPPSYRVATFQKRNGANKIACKTRSLVGSSVPSRSYSDGTISDNNFQIFEATLSPSINSCTFDFPDDEDPSNYQSAIKCVPI